MGIYARISDDKECQQTATARQLEDCRAYAARRGWEIADEFADIDISAYNTRSRPPEFERMIAALRDGEADGVIVWKLDRLTRQRRDLARVMEACERHKALVASVMEPIDTRESPNSTCRPTVSARRGRQSDRTAHRTRSPRQPRA